MASRARLKPASPANIIRSDSGAHQATTCSTEDKTSLYASSSAILPLISLCVIVVGIAMLLVVGSAQHVDEPYDVAVEQLEAELGNHTFGFIVGNEHSGMFKFVFAIRRNSSRGIRIAAAAVVVV